MAPWISWPPAGASHEPAIAAIRKHPVRGGSDLWGLAAKLDWARVDEPVYRRRALYVASLLFFLGSAWSVATYPGSLASLRAAPAVVQLLLAIPLTVVLNAAEFWLSARLLDSRVTRRQAFEVSTLGSAANLLPIPGALLVRVAQLRAGGIGVGRATSVNLLLGLTWCAVATAYAGAWLLTLDPGPLALALLAAAALGFAGTGAVVRSMQLRAHFFFWILLNKIGIVILESVRVLLCFQILGLSIEYAQAAVMVVSSVAGAAVSIVPAGLGVRELVAAALAPIIGIEASAGFLSAAVSRVLEVAVLVPLALLLARRLDPRAEETPTCSS